MALPPRGPSYLGYLSVVCAYDDTVKALTLKCGFDGPSDHWQVAKQFYVLAWDALAASPSWNNCYSHWDNAMFKACTTVAC